MCRSTLHCARAAVPRRPASRTLSCRTQIIDSCMFLLLGPKHDKSNVIYKGIWICRTLFVRASISINHTKYLESPWTTGDTLRLSSKRRLGRANKVIRFTREHGICTTLLSVCLDISCGTRRAPYSSSPNSARPAFEFRYSFLTLGQ